jgi:GT2 family glycosyltransferase
MNKLLSIVIPVMNNYIYTHYVLTNFKNLNSDKYEIIIVDNGSNDGTQNKIIELANDFTNLKYIRNNTNLGFGFACNQGYYISDSQAVMFLNNDIKITNKNYEWLDKLTDDVISSSEPALFGPTGGLVDPRNNYHFVYETNNPNDKINYMSGWCLTAKRSVWNMLVLDDQKGPFDANTFFVYYEDTDCSLRAQQLNIKFVIYPLPIVHIGKQTSKLINTSQLYLQSKEKFIKKWVKKVYANKTKN